MIKINLSFLHSSFCCVCEHVQIFNYQFWDVFQLFSLVILVFWTMTLKEKEVPKQPSCMYCGFLGGLVSYHVRTTYLIWVNVPPKKTLYILLKSRREICLHVSVKLLSLIKRRCKNPPLLPLYLCF
jgi:hypothetical protein